MSVMEPMQAYSLPPTTHEPSTMDDGWSDVKDPKEKKRIQNRIAQRSYRQRMKARLEKLQAKVNYHESIHPETADRDNMSIHSRHSEPLQGPSPPRGLDSMPPDSPEKQAAVMQAQVMQPAFYPHPLDGTDKGLYIQPTQLMGDVPPPPPEGMHQQQMLPDVTEQAMKAEYMRMSKPMSTKGQSPPMENARMQQIPPGHQFLTPEMNDVMDFNNPIDVWTSEMLAQTRRQNSYAMEMLQTPPHQPPTMHPGHHDMQMPNGAPVMDTVRSVSSDSPLQSTEHTGTDDRVEHMLGCAKASGFESFDQLVTAYYNDNFNDGSPLAIEQRLSRNRGLPNVVSDVFNATAKWSDWERRGFHDELLKTTETMLMTEGENARQVLDGFSPLMGAQQNTGPTLVAMKKMVSNEMPNLWALLMALSSGEGEWQRNRSNTVLAAILLLRYPGRIPNDQLRELINGCI